jgi:ABC-type transporter Mla maintaining outer membrane lipid asymmetry permease subunit MlaE
MCDAAGLTGGWLIAVANLNVGSGVYWQSVTDATTTAFVVASVAVIAVDFFVTPLLIELLY